MTARDLSSRTTAFLLRGAGMLFYVAGGIGLLVNGLVVADWVQSRRMPPKGDLAPMGAYALLTIALPILIGWFLRGTAARIEKRRAIEA